MKKGQAGSEGLSLVSGLVLMTLLFIVMALLFLLISKDDADVRTDIQYNKFFEYYQACADKVGDNCYCEDFDYSLLQHEEYITLAQGTDHTIMLQLRKVGLKSPIASKTIQGKELCVYDYLLSTKSFQKRKVEDYTISVSSNARLANIWESYLTLYKEGDDLCFVNYLAVQRGSEPQGASNKVIDPRNPSRYSAQKVEEELKKAHPSCNIRFEEKKEEEPIDPSTLF